MIWNKNNWNRTVSLRNVQTCTTKVYNEYPSKNNLFVITFVTKFYQNSKQEQEPIIKLSAAYTG